MANKKWRMNKNGGQHPKKKMAALNQKRKKWRERKKKKKNKGIQFYYKTRGFLL